ncbi:MAG: hypothetical protein KTR31_34985 [Myxococcales bacterium]|nr:hypothetical protein [Myxococcales bacterium]
MRTLSLVLPMALMAACQEPAIRGDVPDVVHNPADELDSLRVTDTYIQTIPMKADILFVISNWWSSERLQEELIDAFDEMIMVLIDSEIDYHIGAISTDTDHVEDNGKLREANGLRWIDQDTDFPIQTFAQMATMDASGCVGPRRPRDATWMALEHQAEHHNLGYRRDDASMHTIFVSDDVDQSYRMSFDEWVQWYDGFSPDPEVDSLSTIVDFNLDAENVGATNILGGASHEIRDMPWGNVLQQIGLQARGPKTEFGLSRMPVEGSVEVWVNAPTGQLNFTEGTVEEGGDYAYIEARNSILFHNYLPPAGSQIEISYEPVR